MYTLVKEIIKGRKTFFIAPDMSLLPKRLFEEYLLMGYECYIIENDDFLPIETKVELILSIFEDTILFFNVDCMIENFDWTNFLQRMYKKHPSAYFGVLHAKRSSEYERQQLELNYLYNVGLPCGCIQLENSQAENFKIIEKVLWANQAMGRRKNVRAVCVSSCFFHCVTEDKKVIDADLNDVSMTHFSIYIEKNQFLLKEKEIIYNIDLNINDSHIKASASLFMKRQTERGIIYIFEFISLVNKELLLTKIYELLSKNCTELLDKLFTSAKKKSLENKVSQTSDDDIDEDLPFLETDEVFI